MFQMMSAWGGVCLYRCEPHSFKQREYSGLRVLRDSDKSGTVIPVSRKSTVVNYRKPIIIYYTMPMAVTFTHFHTRMVNNLVSLINRKRNSGVLFAILQIIILIFLVINAFLHQYSIGDSIKLFFYQFFAWFLVGCAIASVLINQIKSLTELVALSYALGGIASLLTYFVCMLLQKPQFIVWVVIIESLIAFIYIAINWRTLFCYSIETDGVIPCLIVLIFFYILATLVVSLVNILPTENEIVGYYVDWPFWVGNNIAFIKEFPNQNFRLVGTPFKYHYFSSILMAEISLCSAVDIVSLSFSYSFIFSGLLLVFSSYFFCSRLLNGWYAIISLIAMLFTDGQYVTFSWHTLICPFGFDYGYAYSMMAMASLVEIVRRDRWQEYFIPSVVFLAMTTGCKGPNGMVILTGFGIVAIWYLIKKDFMKGFLGGFAWFGAFLLVFLGFIYSPGTLTTDTGSGLKFVCFNPLAHGIYEALEELGFRYPLITAIFADFLFVFKSNIFASCLLTLVLITVIKDLFCRRVDLVVLSLLVSSVAGSILLLFTRQIGGSEMYFYMATFPASILAGIYIIENISLKCVRKALLISIIPLLVYSSVNWYFIKRTVPIAINGFHQIDGSIDFASDLYSCYADASDYDAFIWLRDHTAYDDVVATDSFLEAHGLSNNLLAGVFSERYIWNEIKYAEPKEESLRRNEIVNLLGITPNAAVNQLAEEGVEYLLHSNVNGSALHLDGLDRLTVVFENSHYTIYHIMPRAD